jgi:hypothetical protein
MKMKWIKLFESFEGEYDVDYIKDVCMTLHDYNLKLDDVKESSAIELPKDKDVVTDVNDFDRGITYKALVLGIKTIEDYQSVNNGNYLINKELFYDDLDDIIHHLESKFNLKLECIFIHAPTKLGFTYYRFLKDFKSNCLSKSPGENIYFFTFEIMFRKLNP